jgi:hypothetical protein
VPPNLAATRVAKALKASRKDMCEVTANMVVNWRERYMQGPGPGVSTDSLGGWLEQFPENFSNTPLKRGNSLVRLLERSDRI